MTTAGEANYDGGIQIEGGGGINPQPSAPPIIGQRPQPLVMVQPQLQQQGPIPVVMVQMPDGSMVAAQILSQPQQSAMIPQPAPMQPQYQPPAMTQNTNTLQSQTNAPNENYFSILYISPRSNQPTGANCIFFLAGFVLMNTLTNYSEMASMGIVFLWYIGLGGAIFTAYLLYKHFLYYRKRIQLRYENKDDTYCIEEDVNCAIMPKLLIIIEVPIRIIVRMMGIFQCILIPVDLFGMPFTVWLTMPLCCALPFQGDVGGDPIQCLSSMAKFPVIFDFVPKYE